MPVGAAGVGLSRPCQAAPVDHVAALQREGAAFVAGMRAADPRTPVAACGTWSVRDLAAHLGSIHRWAAQVVRSGQPGAQRPPPTDDDLADWVAAGIDDLVVALTVDPDRPCWTFSGPGTARWWQRRQALETLVHRVDVQRAGGDAGPVAKDLAVDGVAEVVDVLHPRQVARGRCAPAPGRLLLVAQDTGHRWELPGAAGPASGPTGSGAAAPEVSIAGPAEALLLLLWQRLGPYDPRLRVLGDRALVEQVLAGPLTP